MSDRGLGAAPTDPRRRTLVRRQPRVQLDVVADPVVRELLPLQAFGGESGALGHPAGRWVVDTMPQLKAEQPQFAKAHRLNASHPCVATRRPRAEGTVQYDTHPVAWTRFTAPTATFPNGVSSPSTTAKANAVPAPRSCSRRAIQRHAASAELTSSSACLAISGTEKAASTAGRRGPSRGG